MPQKKARRVRSYLSRLLSDDDYKPKKVRYSTSAMPGSAEKFNVLCERAENGEELWHPLDRMYWDEAKHQGRLF